MMWTTAKDNTAARALYESLGASSREWIDYRLTRQPPHNAAVRRPCPALDAVRISRRPIKAIRGSTERRDAAYGGRRGSAPPRLPQRPPRDIPHRRSVLARHRADDRGCRPRSWATPRPRLSRQRTFAQRGQTANTTSQARGSSARLAGCEWAVGRRGALSRVSLTRTSRSIQQRRGFRSFGGVAWE